jgi:putative ABC transport system ATP-binding protein
VALAGAFSKPSPEFSLPIEPHGNLDAATWQSVIELMDQLNRELGTTLVLVNHDSDLARPGKAEMIRRWMAGSIPTAPA